MDPSGAGAWLAVALGIATAGCAADRPGTAPGSLGREPVAMAAAPGEVQRPPFVYYSPEQRRGRFRTVAEENLGNLDAARPLAPRMIEVDLIVAQQVMDASPEAARKKRRSATTWSAG